MPFGFKGRECNDPANPAISLGTSVGYAASRDSAGSGVSR